MSEEKTNIPETKDYDRNLNQNIHLTLQKNSKTFHPVVTIAPVTDEEYFALQKAVELNAKRLGEVSSDLLQPFAELGRKKLFGYEKFKQEPKDRELISTMQSYFSVTSQIDSVEADDEDVFDYEEATPVSLIFLNNGRETKKHIEYRETTANELDEYFAILANTPSKLSLASHAHKSKEERLFNLSKILKVGSDYINDCVPAWHHTEGVARFCNSEMARLGKS